MKWNRSEDEGEISEEEQRGERGRRIRKHMSRMQRAMKAQTSGLMWRIASFSEVRCEVDDITTRLKKISTCMVPQRRVRSITVIIQKSRGGHGGGGGGGFIVFLTTKDNF